ncbi:hypothetical protein LCDVSa159L [Lymphocystis disease virus 3]|uniref:CARD domain-containing protein n=1 Tax=Lymphocystis disease virus 3 TaxID=2560566 RepID=A0A1B2RW69_9VIRU|nr:hypothetical protein BZK12_gp159 [Lymphocystis disease virus Sa]AOC55243.1 hypothetical protein LCDVSa159L [Lymphocystis disease virus 3]
MAQNLVRIHKIKIIYGGTKCRELLFEKLKDESLISIQEYIDLKSVPLRQTRESLVKLIESMRSKGEDHCRKLIKCLNQDVGLRSFFPFIIYRSKCVKSLVL